MILWNPTPKKNPKSEGLLPAKAAWLLRGWQLSGSTGLCPSDGHTEGKYTAMIKLIICCGKLGKKKKPKQTPQGRPQLFTPLSQEDLIDVFHG